MLGGRGQPCTARSELNTFENVWGGACTVGQGMVMYGGGGQNQGIAQGQGAARILYSGVEPEPGPCMGGGPMPRTGIPPMDRMTERQTRLKTLCSRNFISGS